jgi:periplasmic divalent cation tolerance protein
MIECCVVYITAADGAAAKALGHALVEERLAACANVTEGMTPIFRWDGEIQEDSEAVLIVKTRRALVDALTAFAREHHDYECPCIVALPIIGGNQAFLDWVVEETRDA